LFTLSGSLHILPSFEYKRFINLLFFSRGFSVTAFSFLIAKITEYLRVPCAEPAALQHCDSSFKMPAAYLLSRRSATKTDRFKLRPRKSRDLRLTAPAGVVVASDYII